MFLEKGALPLNNGSSRREISLSMCCVTGLGKLEPMDRAFSKPAKLKNCVKPLEYDSEFIPIVHKDINLSCVNGEDGSQKGLI